MGGSTNDESEEAAVAIGATAVAARSTAECHPTEATAHAGALDFEAAGAYEGSTRTGRIFHSEGEDEGATLTSPFP